ncbi:MAG: dihydroorotate dehydrogenase electron transfer subunit [Tannerellaceae bacterium]|jgi:dihydroorotate dehydrogenase electron transfer subunit|nr:dihydroorotate dehydrogenase electron transfer subunit [Tannerellaceae bacterium]
MKKHILDLIISDNIRLGPGIALLKLSSQSPLPEMLPGQFAQLRIDSASPQVFLRRPISIHYFNKDTNELWLLVHAVGAGTRALADLPSGSIVNMIAPLGNHFTMPLVPGATRLLLVGGGIGLAPLLFLGATLRDKGFEPTFLLGARQKEHLVQLGEFEKYGKVGITTEDGSLGEKGVVLQHSLLNDKAFDAVYACGPKGMMMAVAKYAADRYIPCEVSLENVMACGIGACLCCVEDTIVGYKCICMEGPTFNIAKLKWLH